MFLLQNTSHHEPLEVAAAQGGACGYGYEEHAVCKLTACIGSPVQLLDSHLGGHLRVFPHTYWLCLAHWSLHSVKLPSSACRAASVNVIGGGLGSSGPCQCPGVAGIADLTHDCLVSLGPRA